MKSRRTKSSKYRTLRRTRQLGLESLEERRVFAINGALLYEGFDALVGPSSSRMYAVDETFGEQSVTCFEINEACDTLGSDPAWSPDGTKILFSGPGTQLHVVDVANRQLRPVVDANGSPVSGLTPTWVGPTSSGISFAGATSDSGNTSYDILYAPITLFDDRAEIGALKNLTPHIAGDFTPSWNPEGTSVVFDSNREGGDIYRIDGALTDNPVLTNLTADRPTFGDFKPDWSRDGSKIVFFSATPVNDIWVMDPDGSNQHNVTNDAFSDDFPSWSPDGTKIVYVSSRFEDGVFTDPEIYTIHADGTGLHQVTDNAVFDWNPDWQPVPEANLNLDIRDVVDPIAEGDIAEYTVKVKNGGPELATRIRVVTEPLPAFVEFQSIINDASCSLGEDRRVTCQMGDAEAGVSVVKPLKLRLNQHGTFTLTGSVYTDSEDSVPINDTTSETTLVAFSADLSVSVAESSDPVTTLEALTYTVSVTNHGPSTAFDVVLTDTLPADLDIITVTSTLCAREGRVVTCHFDEITPHTTLPIKIVVGKKSTDTIVNVAEVVVHGSVDNLTFNNQVTTETAVVSPVDTDGDSLFDVWETKGVDINQDGVIDLDLPALGADPMHKDIYVEVDFMDCAVGGCSPDMDFTTRPIKGALESVVAAFANAPVENLDEVDGISLWVQPDEALRMSKDTRFQGRGPADRDDFDDFKLGSNSSEFPGVPCGNQPWDGHFGTTEDRASSNCANILEARRQVFRYSVFGVNFVEGTRVNGATTDYSTGVAEVGGNDFFIALGTLNEGSFQAMGGTKDLAQAIRNVESGTFMHEFGHTLGLTHGGSTDDNYKPNYLSVMNYDFQNPSLDVNRPLDFSRQALPNLDEHDLDEPAGVGGPAGRVVYTRAFDVSSGSPEVVILNYYANAAIDWSLDGDLDDLNIEADVNADGEVTVLRGHDDWQNLIYNFRTSSQFANGVRVGESDEQQSVAELVEAAGMVDVDGDGLSNAADNCPGISNANQADANGNGVGDACESANGTVDLQVQSGGESMLTDDGPVLAVKFYVTNSGNLPATGLTISVPALTDATLLSDDNPDGVSCSAVGGAIICSGYTDLSSGQTLTGRLLFRPAHVGAYAHEVQVTTSATDADTADNKLAGSTQVTRNTFGLGWQNEANALDVDVDGSIAPIDALVIINELNEPLFSGPTGKLPAPPVAGVTFYFDVDGDGYAVAQDALFIINALNPNGEAEGESVGQTLSARGLASEVRIARDRKSESSTEPKRQSHTIRTINSSEARPLLANARHTPGRNDEELDSAARRASRKDYPALVDWLMAHGM